MLANRLRRNLKHLRKWARRNQVDGYRIYHQDIPEYPLLCDLFQGAEPDSGLPGTWLVAYLSRPPRDRTDDEFRQEVAAELLEATELPPERLILKERGKRSGGLPLPGSQAGQSVWLDLQEAGRTFRLNLTEHHDCGLFLDHRLTRALAAELARGKDVLNLFAYTGSFTVYAATGGARSSLSLDMSRTYLDWAALNLDLNGVDRRKHQLERADILAWLPEAARSSRRFDLIVCDPPTFSNSKKMQGAFDVQHDQVSLIQSCLRLLSRRGQLLFSTNRQGFVLERGGLVVEDLSGQTLPEDFRNRTPHQAFLIRGDRSGR